MLSEIAAWAAWGKAKSLWQAIPNWLKLFVLIAALLFAHQWYAHRQLKAADAAGYKRGQADLSETIKNLQARLAASDAAIAADERKKNDAKVITIAAAAGSLSLHGPGKATCPRPVAVSAASREPVAPAGAGSPAPTAVPSENGDDALAAVPWRWLVGTGEQCDLERAENVAWRNDYARRYAEWVKVTQASKP